MIQTRYILVGCPRTGSTAIHLILKGHPNIAVLNDEIRISPFFTTGISTFTHGNETDAEKHAGFLALFDALASISANDKTCVLGAKSVCIWPFEAQIFVNTLQRYLPDFKVIILHRHDLVAQYGSWIQAQRTGIWHIWNDSQRPHVSPITLNKWLVIRYALNCFEITSILRDLAASHQVMECAYEDFLQRPENFQQELFHFLEIPQVSGLIEQPFIKVLPKPEDYIRNYAELTEIITRLRRNYVNHEVLPITRIIARVHNRLYRIAYITEATS